MSVSAWILDLPVRRPLVVLALTVCATAWLAGGIERIRVDASIESMIVEGDRDHAEFQRKKQIFGSDEVVAIALAFEDALAADSLALQTRVVERLKEFPEIAKIESLVNSDDIVGGDHTLYVEPLVPDQLDAATVANVRRRIETNSLWTGFLISRDRRTAAIQLHLDDPSATGLDRGSLMAAIEAVVQQECGDVPYYFAGHPFMKTEIARTMQQDLTLFLPVTLGAMALFLLVCVGSFRLALVMLTGVLLAVVWMVGAMGRLGQPITALSNTAPTILLALGTAYLMHLAASYQRAVSNSEEGAPELVRRALSRVRKPIIVAGLTTAIGFAFIAGSRVPLVRGFGIDLTIGILAVLVLACFPVPAMLVLLPPTPGRGILAQERRLGTVLFRLAHLVASRSRFILGAALLLFLAAVAASSQLEVDSSGPNAFAKDSRFRISSEFYREHFSGDVIENVYLSGQEGDFTEPERLRRMLALQAAIEDLPEVDKTISIANYIGLMNRAIHNDDPAQERIPKTRAAVAQYLLLYSSSGDPHEFDDLVDPFYSEARIVLKATVLSSRESAELRQKLTDLVEAHLGEDAERASVLSTEILLSQAADTLAVEQARSLLGALVMILITVAVAFRSIKAGVLLGLPNGLPVALNFGVMALLGITLRDVTSVIAVTALGIAVDSTVHLLQAIRVSEAEHGSRRAATVEALMTTGRPVIVTGFIIVAGFSVLLLSDFRVISDFGGLTALAIFFALVSDIFVLPAQILIGGASGEAIWMVTAGRRAVPALRVGGAEQGLYLRALGEARELQDYEGPVELSEFGNREMRPARIQASGGLLLVTPAEAGRPTRDLAALFMQPRRKEFEYAGFRFRVADSVEERQRAYRFRYEVFVEEGFIDPSDFAGGMFRDALDEVSVQLLATDATGRIVGATRVVLPTPLGFQTEQLFDFPAPPIDREQLGEVGRLAIAAEHRGGVRVPMVGLIKMIYDELRGNGLTHAFAFMPRGLIHWLASLGCVSRLLGDGPLTPQTLERRRLMRGYFERQEVHPVLFDLDEIDRTLRARAGG